MPRLVHRLGCVLTSSRRRCSRRPSCFISTTMPSEFYTALDDQPPLEHVQTKVCSSCHRPVDPASHLFLLAADAIVCAACGPIHGQTDPRTTCIDVDNAYLRLGRSTYDQEPSDTQRPAPPPPPSFASKLSSLSVHTPTTTVSSSQPLQSHAPTVPVANPNRRHTALVSLSPNPLTDITRLRVRHPGSPLSLPGCLLQGTQKSGRNSYDVTVTIVVRMSLRLSCVCSPATAGRRLFVVVPLRLPLHPRSHRRLSRAHHLL